MAKPYTLEVKEFTVLAQYNAFVDGAECDVRGWNNWYIWRNDPDHATELAANEDVRVLDRRIVAKATAEDGTIVGVAIVGCFLQGVLFNNDDTFPHIKWAFEALSVQPQWRRRGVATAMVQALLPLVPDTMVVQALKSSHALFRKANAQYVYTPVYADEHLYVLIFGPGGRDITGQEFVQLVTDMGCSQHKPFYNHAPQKWSQVPPGLTEDDWEYDPDEDTSGDNIPFDKLVAAGKGQ